MKPGTSFRCVSRDVQTRSNSEHKLGTTLKRFIAMNICEFLIRSGVPA